MFKRMRTWKWIVFCGCLVPTLASAAIYKWVDSNGHVVFSDQPHPGAQKVELPPISTFSDQGAAQKPATATTSSKAKKRPAAIYHNFVIVKPTAGETFWNNVGTLDVQLGLTPPELREGDKILINLDGKPQGKGITTPRFTLHNLDRGTHVLSASVVDGAGRTLITAPSVTFYLHKASALFPNRRNNSSLPSHAPLVLPPHNSM